MYHSKKPSSHKIPRACRVLRSFEPAFAGGLDSETPPWLGLRVISVRQVPHKIGVGSKPRVQYHEHSRA